MNDFPPALKRSVLLRSFFVQGSWNYETLIGIGFAFTILPILRYVYRDDPAEFKAALARNSQVFNSHPYLANVAAGAVSRLESEGTDPRVILRFKSALRGSLGSVGDQLVWGAWRPAAALLGLLAMISGAPWWVAILVFLSTYNAINIGLRVWGWRVGVSAGIEVGRAIREAPLQLLARRAAEVGCLVCGAAVAVGSRSVFQDPLAAGVNGVAVAVGIWLGLRARAVMSVVLGIVIIIGIVSGIPD